MTLGSHQTCIGKSQVHITPQWILERLGPFDVDPCAADPRPWDCAKQNITEAEDGLSKEWNGRVFLTAALSLNGFSASPITIAASHCFTREQKRVGSRRYGFKHPASCFWLTGSSSAGQTGASTPLIPARRR